MWFISMRRYSNSATNVNGLFHEFLHGKEVSYIYMQKNPEKYKTKETDFIMFRIEGFCSESNTQTKYDKSHYFFSKVKELAQYKLNCQICRT